MSADIRGGIVTLVALVLQMLGLILAIGFDSFIDKRRKRVFIAIAVFILSLIAQNYVEYWLVEYYTAIYFRTVVAMYGYIVRPIILVLFAYIVAPTKKHIVAWTGMGINTLVHLTALFSKLCFWITEENKYKEGPLSACCLVISALLLIYIAYLSIKNLVKTKSKELFIPLILAFVIVLGIVADALFNMKRQWVDYVTIVIVSVSVFYYVWLHLQFVRDHEKALVAEQKMQILMSQVQPHFIYNTLSAIRNIEGNPEETKTAITEFAKYIRVNLTAFDGKEVIPFEKEMDNVKDYVQLQRLRFGTQIEALYDIRDEDFSIPPLTVQILVENAIKHGITSTYDKGTVIVKSFKESDFHVVQVIDNGVGFDTSILEKTDRVGLRVVKNRLEYYLGATIEITSEKGIGTYVTVKIPTIVTPPPEN